MSQIGKKGASKGNRDTENTMRPPMFYYAPTNELFVADGYGNKRIIVFDGDTGKYKRMWGAFGNEPLDNVPAPPKVSEDERIPAKELPASNRGPEQFVRPVHAVRVSNDGLVYVSDRGGRRVQVFSLDGKYVTQVFIDRYCEAWHGPRRPSTAFSHDPEQKHFSGKPQRRARLGAGSQDAGAARFIRPQRRGARRVLRHAPHECGFEGQPLRHGGPGRKANPEVRVQGVHHNARHQPLNESGLSRIPAPSASCPGLSRAFR